MVYYPLKKKWKITSHGLAFYVGVGLGYFVKSTKAKKKKENKRKQQQRPTYCEGILEKIKCSKNVSCSASWVAEILSNVANSSALVFYRENRKLLNIERSLDYFHSTKSHILDAPLNDPTR